ncbi:hypothetical protein C8A05DRAFT_13369 [Staphylotrichum tortipilum]|uniref:HNH nuclease domain-containing protein n=1 Tax=Staphylotrichum tortipilum TaxID=2831512 RepID=A0AAN6MQV7_9PEZI|nr:hypothetical protein C8A05DRAFT_13369 [Staphylotrichum longicolle]
MAPLPPLAPPSAAHAPAPRPRVVRFRHPAYPNSTPDLLVLMAADGGDNNGGLDFDVALTSCCIITNTPWDDGYLALKATAPASVGAAGVERVTEFQRVERPHDGLLRGTDYFFCVDGREPSSDKYPVVPSLQHWRFPHGDLPPTWTALQLSDHTAQLPTVKGLAAARARDVTCRISAYMDAVEIAHLVPAAERLWFVSNGMQRYCWRPLEASAINDENNLIVLRRDIHYLFDSRRFTLIPKRFITDPVGSLQLVSHVLIPSGSPELVGLYHNRSPQSIRGISLECLFARFAWSLFTDEHVPFFGSGLKYAVRLWSEEKNEAEIQTLRGHDIGSRTQVFDSTTRSQSRSISPRKRPRPTQGNDSLANGGGGYWSDDEEEMEDAMKEKDYCDAQDQPPRGRTMKRSGWG